MGIPGLTSYIMKQSDKFSKTIKLHETHLVIDGYRIAYELYTLSKCNFCFGGDYVEYAFYISEFLEELSKCSITPLIVFDGGLEDKQFETIFKCSKERLLRISYSTPTNEQEILPILVKNVFRYIVQKKRIKTVQSSFAADDHIASIARILDCPLLSNNSDFFMFDVKYIPFSSLEKGISKNMGGIGFVKICKLYTHDDFVKNFPGLNKNNLPLAAALLGNDYIDSNICNSLFSYIQVSMKLTNYDAKNNLHDKIELVLRWLQQHTLDGALTVLLRKVDEAKREEMLQVMEMIINGYFVPSSEMLQYLGYSSRKIHQLTERIPRPYKFLHSDDSQSNEEQNDRNDEMASLTLLNKDVNKLSIDKSGVPMPSIRTKINKSIPLWFMKEFHAAKFPGYFMDMIHRQLIVITEQMENQKEPPCIFISLKILRVIFRLLNNGITNSKELYYIARGKGAEPIKYKLECDNNFVKNQELPTLDQLKELSESKRRNIFINTFEIDYELLMEFPTIWRVYIIVIKYWCVKADKRFVTKWHVYSLILMMIYHVVQRVIKVGSYYGNTPVELNKDYKPVKTTSVEMSVILAVRKVSKTECIKVEGFFKPYMIKNESDFDIDIVHSFSLLQNSLRYGMDLNTLLGHPYYNLNVSEFFNGTMIYNFYKDLRKYRILNQRITKIFYNSYGLLQVFISISTKFQAFLDANANE